MEPLSEFEDKSNVWREMRLLDSTEMEPVIPEPERFKPITCFWLTSHVIPFYLHTWVVGDQFFMAPNGSTSSDLILRSKLVSVAFSLYAFVQLISVGEIMYIRPSYLHNFYLKLLHWCSVEQF
jgi:hypothetical protein